MIASPSFTGIYSYVANEFKRLRMRAGGAWLLTKILGRRNGLKSLAYIRSLDLRNKRNLGIQHIQIKSIIGTLGRNTDFDGNFRPLKNHLLDRWVNMYLRLDTDGWAPIIAHKLDDEYYVEDGHHRVSVAKFVGMVYIEAVVWDHSGSQTSQRDCPRRREMSRKRSEVCSASS
jgi:hypothetical protein